MIKPPHQRLGFAVLALTLISSVAASAQGTASTTTPSMRGSGPPGAGLEEGHGEWNNENFNRQNFREEMEQIRKEHEELENASDKLLDKCVNSAAAQAAECQSEKQSLHERREKLHERAHALREKMQASRPDKGSEHGAGSDSNGPPRRMGSGTGAAMPSNPQ